MKIKDKNYTKIVNNILSNEEFNEIKKIEHHGITRFDHSLKVSYYSYIIAKTLKLDYIATARAGLLHDFFISSNDRSFNERFISTFIHPKKAVENARKFGINEMEENIIKSHMFPFYTSIPKYAESWIVIGVDKTVGFKEFVQKFSHKFIYAYNLSLIFLLTLFK